MRVTSLQEWTWSQPENTPNVSFYFTHDRSIDVILNSQRGEGFVKQVFRLLLTGCAHGAGSVLDIGSNTGYYSMASAAHGCPVLAIDAQPGCRQWFEQARAANEANASRPRLFSHSRVRLVTQPVSSSGVPVEIDKWACWVMHKIDKRLRRRRQRASAAQEAMAAVATGSMAPPPPNCRTQSGRCALFGRPGNRERLTVCVWPG